MQSSSEKDAENGALESTEKEESESKPEEEKEKLIPLDEKSQPSTPKLEEMKLLTDIREKSPLLPDELLTMANAKKLALALGVLATVIHGIGNLLHGSKPCKGLLEDGRVKGYLTEGRWQPIGCMMHLYTAR